MKPKDRFFIQGPYKGFFTMHVSGSLTIASNCQSQKELFLGAGNDDDGMLLVEAALAQKAYSLSNRKGPVRELACEILDIMAEGLGVSEASNFLRHHDSESLLRLNHYPPLLLKDINVAFGEHSDPQILSLLRSNDGAGLQISLPNGLWFPVSPDPSAFFVNVGDALQVMTNGRFVSVRRRAMTNSHKSRMSMASFGAPPLNACIAALPEMVTSQRPSLYRPFTWAEYKQAAYSLRLGDHRIHISGACAHK